MDRDPELLDLLALEMLDYAEAHAVHKSAKKESIEAWGDSPVMKAVTEYAHERILADMPTAEELRAAGYAIIGDEGAGKP